MFQIFEVRPSIFIIVDIEMARYIYYVLCRYIKSFKTVEKEELLRIPNMEKFAGLLNPNYENNKLPTNKPDYYYILFIIKSE